MPPNLSPDFIAAAIAGFQEQKRRLDFQIAELKQMSAGPICSGFSAKTGGALGPPTKKRRFSAGARTKMAEGQRKMWAAMKEAINAFARLPSGFGGTQLAKDPLK